jgi:hypothetical protein
MTKRIVIKTSLICIGISFSVFSLLTLWFLNNFRFDENKNISIVIAKEKLSYGMYIKQGMITTKEVNISQVTKNMVTDPQELIGKRVIQDFDKNDYVYIYGFSHDDLSESDSRIVTIPVTIEQRHANLVKKGCLVDIKYSYSNNIPVLVLSKVRIEDVLNENGMPGGESAGNKTCYLKLILSQDQRNKIYNASETGKPVLEIYLSDNQKAQS